MKTSRELLKTYLENIFILITFLPLYFMFLFALASVGLPAMAIQFVVGKLAKVLYPDWIGLMSGKDAIVGVDNMNKPRNALLWYNTLEGRVTLEQIITNFNEFIIQRKNPSTGEFLYPRFQQYYEPWLGYNFWKWDTKFEIQNHIKFLPGSGIGVVTTEKDLLHRLGSLATASFPSKRPYWECFCVPNYLPSGESIPKKTMIVYRVHHGIGDGYSFLKCFMQHLCNDNLEKVIKLKSKEKSSNKVWELLGHLWFLIQIPYVILRQCFIDIDSNPWFLPTRELKGDSYLSMTKKISIPSIKRVYKEYNVSFSSVLFSSLAGGINKYLKINYNGSMPNKIPGVIRCFTPFPWKNHPNGKLTNYWTCASVPIFPGIECPQERMERTERSLETLKLSPAPLINYLIMPLAATLPVWFLKFGNWFNTAILSNFPGPTEHVSYYKKYKVEDLNFWAPHLNGRAGIGITMMSYVDGIRFGLNFDKAILPHQKDIDELCYYIEEEFDKLFHKTVAEDDIYIEKKLFSDDENQNENQTDMSRQRRNSKLLRNRSVS